MRIQKAITASGLASRREAEAMIMEGRVQVNKEQVLLDHLPKIPDL